MDLDVLSVMRKRDNYEKFAQFIKPSSLGQESWNIFNAMGEWWKQNPQADEIDWSAFNAWFTLVRHAKMDKDKLGLHKELITILEGRDEDDSELLPLVQGLARRDFAGRIAEIALGISDGDHKHDFGNIADLVSQHDSYSGKINRIDNSIVTFSAQTLREVREPGLKFRLNALRQSMGDLRKGDFVIFGKRPDSGGTTFLASEVTYMAEQMGHEESVLWLNNEEEGKKVSSRITQAALGWTEQMMEEDPDGAHRTYEEIMGRPDKIVLVDLADMHINDVNRFVDKYEPSLIVFDQLHKVHGFESQGEGQDKQTLLANYARELAKKYAPVITVMQAGMEADNVKWPNYSTLFGSKTGVQGEADAIIMLGRKWNEGDARGIWVPKNKMKGEDRTAKNKKYEIIINPDIARFEEA